MNIEQARFNMVEQQIRPWNLEDQDVLNLLFVVKRESFAPTNLRALAFADTELPLEGATDRNYRPAMLAPRMEARILQALAMKRREKVLEVGAGSGYMAALLAAHAERVWSIEIDAGLAEVARANLRRSGIENVTVETGNGLEGLATQAPFDVIVLSGAVAEVPHVLLSQLKSGGRMLAFVGEAPSIEMQSITRDGDKYTIKNLMETEVEPLRHAGSTARFSF